MDAQKQREIASKGGRAAHQKGTAHEFTPDEARIAGRKGGEAVSANRQHMAEIGRRGGRATRSTKKSQDQDQGQGQGQVQAETGIPRIEQILHGEMQSNGD